MSAAPGLPALLAIALAVGPAPAAAATDADRGRTVFHQGTSPSGGTITAVVGGTILPGAAVPCAGCHGADGRGRAEGGVVPPDVSWSALAKPYGHVHPDGRAHPAFDERTAIRAVTEGLDPAGHELAPAMPRYAMPPADLRDLVAYLRIVEREPAPGTTARTIRIGTVVPSIGPLAELGASLRALLEAEVEAVNGAGGIHGRRLELAVVSFDPARERGSRRLAELHGRAPLFAVVGGVLPGDEEELAAFAAREELPWLGPLTHLELEAGAGWVFRPIAGLSEEARVLIRHAASALPAAGRRGAVVHPRDSGHAAAARAAADEARRVGLELEAHGYDRGAFDPALADLLADRASGFVLFLGGDDELRAFARRAGPRRWAPQLLVPGTGAVRAAVAIDAAAAGRVRLAFPSVPGVEAPAAIAALGRASPAFRSGRYRAAIVSVHAAAAVLAEGLRCAGRQLDRRRLVACLEGLHGFETGLLPPIGFGPGRRVGSPGGFVVAPARDGGPPRPVGGFVRLDAEPARSR